MWLFVMFLAIPLIEIGLFIQIGGFIGLWPTLAIVIITAFLGTMLMRTQGALAMNNLRTSLSDLKDPTEPLAHGAMILVAGALLLTPGFFTDAVGFLLLIPPVRSAVYNYARSRIKVNNFTVGEQSKQQNYSSGTVIDGEFKEIDPNSPDDPASNSGWTKD